MKTELIEKATAKYNRSLGRYETEWGDFCNEWDLMTWYSEGRGQPSERTILAEIHLVGGPAAGEVCV